MKPLAIRSGEYGRAPGTTVANQHGFIVLGALVLIFLVLAVGVALGKVVRRQYPDSYVDTSPARIQWVHSDTDVRSGARVAARLRRGDRVWAKPMQTGEIAIYADPEATRFVGFVWGPALSESPAEPQ